MQALELRSGIKQEVEVKPTYGITDEQVEQMLLDSITHAKSDVDQRMLIEAKTEGEQMIYTVERFLQKNNHFLTDLEITDTNKYLQTLKDILVSDDKDAIHKSIDSLNDFTRPFAERLMDEAIAVAMKGKRFE